jgi:hypothetical protein
MEKTAVKTILGYLPDSLLSNLTLEHKVDKQVKKLEGKIVFKLLLYGVLSSSQLSLNVLISLFDKLGFRSLIGVDDNFTTKRNSLADRLVALNSDFFKAIFEESVEIFSKHLPACQINGYNIHRFDSTLIACSSKLLDFGMQTGRKTQNETYRYNHLKFTVGFNGSMPEIVKFYDKPSDIGEDLPLSEVIKEMAFSSNDVAVFDRGLKSRKVFDAFSTEGQKRLFVCRINPTKEYKVIETKMLQSNISSPTLTILSDQIVKIYGQYGKISKNQFRLVIAEKKDDSTEKMFFLTNILDDLSPIEIATIYRLRWDIEKFFRFIKQNLNRAANRFSHLLSRNYNAIKNMTYVMLIAAMFIALFNKLNNRKGFKISKLTFIYELEIEIVKELVIRCNGDPNLLNQLIAMRFGQ